MYVQITARFLVRSTTSSTSISTILFTGISNMILRAVSITLVTTVCHTLSIVSSTAILNTLPILNDSYIKQLNLCSEVTVYHWNYYN